MRKGWSFYDSFEPKTNQTSIYNTRPTRGGEILHHQITLEKHRKAERLEFTFILTNTAQAKPASTTLAQHGAVPLRLGDIHQPHTLLNARNAPITTQNAQYFYATPSPRGNCIRTSWRAPDGSRNVSTKSIRSIRQLTSRDNPASAAAT